MLVEQHIRLMGRMKSGGMMEVALEPPFCNALDKLEGKSAMPVARGVTTMPVVAVDEKGRATLRMPVGLDRETGVIFRIPKALRSVMPKGAPTREEARQAYVWLRDEWLCDVCTDEQGKATLIAMALTIIQRHDFTERPDFILSGAKAGTGKTTAANMVSAAVLGHRAAATAWSSFGGRAAQGAVRDLPRRPRPGRVRQPQARHGDPRRDDREGADLEAVLGPQARRERAGGGRRLHRHGVDGK